MSLATLCQCSLFFDLQGLDNGSQEDASAAGGQDGFAAPADAPDVVPDGTLGPAGDGPGDAMPEDSNQGASDGTVSDVTDGTAVGASDSTTEGSAPRDGGPSDAAPDTGADGSVDSGGDGVAPGSDAGDAGGACDPAKPFGAPVLLTSLQSANRDGNLRLLPDELTGFFWSARWDAGTAALYVTTRADNGSAFGNVSLLNNVNTATAQYDPSVTGDGLTLAFRSNRDGGAGRDDLYGASRATVGGDFSGVAPITAVNSASNDVQPFLTPSGAEIYFSSDRTGDYDIYRATGSGGTYGAPAPVSEVNMTGVVDQNPVVSADDLTILFSSDRTGGVGSRDIWIATRSSTSAMFAAASDLGAVNTTGNDYPGWLSVDGCRLYLHSDISGATHIYLATRPP